MELRSCLSAFSAAPKNVLSQEWKIAALSFSRLQGSGVAFAFKLHTLDTSYGHLRSATQTSRGKLLQRIAAIFHLPCILRSHVPLRCSEASIGSSSSYTLLPPAVMGPKRLCTHKMRLRRRKLQTGCTHPDSAQNSSYSFFTKTTGPR